MDPGWGLTAREEICRRRPGGPGGQEVEQEYAGCPCSDKGSSHPGLQ